MKPVNSRKNDPSSDLVDRHYRITKNQIRYITLGLSAAVTTKMDVTHIAPIHDDCGLKSYTRAQTHLVESMKSKRLVNCKEVTKYFKNHGSTVKSSQ